MEEAHAAAEVIQVNKALGMCGYLKWSFRRARESMDKRKQEELTKKKKEDSDRNTKTTVTIPYVKGVLEALNRVFRHHCVVMAMKPFLLVHPKDKSTPQENSGVVYQVPYKDCPCVYTGETERRYGKETPMGCKIFREIKFTLARKKDSVSKVHPSAITDHVIKNNHTIDWKGVIFPSRACDIIKRGIWEAIAIKKTGAHAINCDGGATNFYMDKRECVHLNEGD